MLSRPLFPSNRRSRDNRYKLSRNKCRLSNQKATVSEIGSLVDWCNSKGDREQTENYSNRNHSNLNTSRTHSTALLEGQEKEKRWKGNKKWLIFTKCSDTNLRRSRSYQSPNRTKVRNTILHI